MLFRSDRGVEGFRLDVIDQIAKDPDRQITANGPRLHEFLRELSAETFQKGCLVTVGEAWGADLERAKLYSAPDGSELSMVFQFEQMLLDQEPGKEKWDLRPLPFVEMKKSFARWQQGLHGCGFNSLFLNNHDLPRIVSRWGNDGTWRVQSAKLLATMLHGMEGMPYIYQGEELGLFEAADIPWDQLEDPTAFHTVRAGAQKGRDGCRVPLPWVADDCRDTGDGPYDHTGSFGFSPARKTPGAGVTADMEDQSAEPPHLPQPRWYAQYAVDAEENDPHSMLNLYRAALRLRHRVMPNDTELVWLDQDAASDVRDGADGNKGGVVAYRRSNGWAVLTNFGAEPVALPEGEVLLASGELTADGRLPQDTSVWMMLD